jgi:hypothetical protein
MSQPHIAEALFSCNECESGVEGYTTFRGQTCVGCFLHEQTLRVHGIAQHRRCNDKYVYSILGNAN